MNQPAGRHQLLITLVSLILVSLMLGCLGAAFRTLGERIIAGFVWFYLPPLLWVVTLLAFGGRTLALFRTASSEWAVTLGEMVVLLLGLKLFLLLHGGLGSLPPQVVEWGRNPFTFFDAEYLTVFIIVLFTWWVARHCFDDLIELHRQELPLPLDEPGRLDTYRREARERLVERTLTVGLLLTTLTTLTRVDWIWTPGRFPPAPTINVVLYFVFLLALLSLTQFAMLRQRWQWQNAPVSTGLAPGWLIYGLVFLAGVGLLALLLPAGSTLGLINTLQLAVIYLMQLALLLVSLLVTPFALLFAWITGAGPVSVPVQLKPPAGLPTPGGTEGGTPPWLAVVRSVVFWAAFVLVAVLALRYFIRENRAIFARMMKLPLLQALLRVWNWLRGQTARLTARARAEARSVIQRLQRAAPTPPILPPMPLRFGRLTPRQQLIYLYLKLVERGDRHGLPRQPAQTPREYGRLLAERLPDSAGDAEAVTHEFEEARYSRHAIAAEEASLFQRLWRRLMRRIDRNKS